MQPLAVFFAFVALSACLLSLSAPASAGTSTAQQESVQFPGADVTLAGELFLPADRADKNPRHPAMVFMHGCGGMYNTRGQITARSRDWAQRFAEWGFVVLLVDSLGPRGLGSLCELENRPIYPWKERTLDAYAALEFVATRADVEREKVFVIGWSHGGSTVTGVVRADAPGRRADGPKFKAAIAYYPSCERALRAKSYRPIVPLLIQHGEADEWTAAAPCVELAQTLRRSGFPVQTITYPSAHHGFDSPNNKLRFLPNVYNPRAPGERGAHVGTHEASRIKAIADTKRFIDEQLAR